MRTPTKVNGVITGRTIELDLEPGFPTGQKVLVTIEPAKSESDNQGSLAPGEGLRRAFGAWAEEAEELDKYLEWSRQQRKVGRAPIERLIS